MAWLYLGLGVLSELVGSLALRMASVGRRAWFLLVAVGYFAAFFALTQTLSEGMGIGIAYGVWAAFGVAATAIASRLLFKEPLTSVMCLGMLLIVIGVLLVELGSPHA